MLILSKTGAMEHMVEETARSTYRVELTKPGGTKYTRDSRAATQHAAFGEVLHAYTNDHAGANLNALGESRIWPLNRRGEPATEVDA